MKLMRSSYEVESDLNFIIQKVTGEFELDDHWIGDCEMTSLDDAFGCNLCVSLQYKDKADYEDQLREVENIVTLWATDEIKSKEEI